MQRGEIVKAPKRERERERERECGRELVKGR